MQAFCDCIFQSNTCNTIKNSYNPKNRRKYGIPATFVRHDHKWHAANVLRNVLHTHFMIDNIENLHTFEKLHARINDIIDGKVSPHLKQDYPDDVSMWLAVFASDLQKFAYQQGMRVVRADVKKFLSIEPGA